jgi:hypothetical protein
MYHTVILNKTHLPVCRLALVIINRNCSVDDIFSIVVGAVTVNEVVILGSNIRMKSTNGEA